MCIHSMGLDKYDMTSVRHCSVTQSRFHPLGSARRPPPTPRHRCRSFQCVHSSAFSRLFHFLWRFLIISVASAALIASTLKVDARTSLVK